MEGPGTVPPKRPHATHPSMMIKEPTNTPIKETKNPKPHRPIKIKQITPAALQRAKSADIHAQRCLIENCSSRRAIMPTHALERGVGVGERMASALEWNWNMQRNTLNLDTRRNIFFVGASIRQLYEEKRWALLPEDTIIQQYFDKTGEAVLPRTAFPVLKAESFQYRLIPIQGMDEVYLTRQTDLPNGTRTVDIHHPPTVDIHHPPTVDIHHPPFDDFPILTSHVDPKFAILHLGALIASESLGALIASESLGALIASESESDVKMVGQDKNRMNLDDVKRGIQARETLTLEHKIQARETLEHKTLEHKIQVREIQARETLIHKYPSLLKISQLHTSWLKRAPSASEAQDATCVPYVQDPTYIPHVSPYVPYIPYVPPGEYCDDEWCDVSEPSSEGDSMCTPRRRVRGWVEEEREEREEGGEREEGVGTEGGVGTEESGERGEKGEEEGDEGDEVRDDVPMRAAAAGVLGSPVVVPDSSTVLNHITPHGNVSSSLMGGTLPREGVQGTGAAADANADAVLNVSDIDHSDVVRVPNAPHPPNAPNAPHPPNPPNAPTAPPSSAPIASTPTLPTVQLPPRRVQPTRGAKNPKKRGTDAEEGEGEGGGEGSQNKSSKRRRAVGVAGMKGAGEGVEGGVQVEVEEVEVGVEVGAKAKTKTRAKRGKGNPSGVSNTQGNSAETNATVHKESVPVKKPGRPRRKKL